MKIFDGIFSSLLSYGSQDFVLSARERFPDGFWLLSTELSRRKAEWLGAVKFYMKFSKKKLANELIVAVVVKSK